MTPTLLFFQSLFAGYGPANLTLEIRPLYPLWREAELYPPGNAPDGWRTRHGQRQWFPIAAPGAIEAAARHCEQLAGRMDVYMGVLPRIGFGQGGRYDVGGAGWLWCDVDGGEAGIDAGVALVKRSGLPKPHLVVMSGGGLHCYWRLTEAVPLADKAACDAFKGVLQRLVKRIGGTSPAAHADSSRADTASILRPPGTVNLKRREEPRPVKLLRHCPDCETWSYDRWGAFLPPEPVAYVPQKEWKPLPFGEVRPLPPSVEEVFRRPTLTGQRHITLLNATRVARGYGFDEAALYILAETFTNINSWDLNEANGIVRNTMRRIPTD